jgi:PAS domain S-box-containing protein
MQADDPHSILSQLTESEARYRAVIENASDMIQSVRPDGKFEFVNRAWIDKLGYDEDEVERMTIWDIIHPDSVEHCMQLFVLASEGKSIPHVEATFVKKNGDPIPVEGNATVRMVDGKVIATHSFFRDVSERIRAAELEERNAQLEREQFARYLEKMAALGKLSAGLAHELNNPAAAARRASKNMSESLAERDSAARELVEAGLDVTSWRKLDDLTQRLVQLPEQDRHANPLELSEREEHIEAWLEDAWSLASSLAQTGIQDDDLASVAESMPAAALEAGLRWINASVDVADLTSTIASSTNRISELVGSIKAYSYMDKAAEQIVDVHEGLENTLIILAHRLKNISVTKDFDRSLPHVRAFGSGLNQVWTNIIDNAADATSEHGAITIRTHAQDESVVVEIEDNGCGIPPENLTRIFEPFFTTKQQGQGTGLGLDMAWRIVTDEHGGTLDVESLPGKTVFRATLPAIC